MTPLFHIDPPSVADAGDELSIQVGIRKALKARAPTVAFVAVPNGAQRTAWASIKAKQEGLASGFPDAIVLWSGGYAFPEIKNRTGTLSEQQHVWLNYLTKGDHPCGVFRSVATCLRWLAGLGAPIDLEGLA
ncbi:VRR-NUC domain-containing protein [Sphingomonas panacisoli]|uniref:VRR-NUC domain-containing protein n=1 Tax=Sphingomonas panacisoli TaxID=1813879 RepID=A0A5B8LIP3_9SPHN|nr:VRR-NUC domain-containing protein [Sphingomonas panacisoli]QDZ07474.1 VRR-NUC domain-containing protein [Sphingomonas panacisoli]